MLETRLRNTGTISVNPSSTVNAQSGLVIVKNDQGGEKYYNPTADTDAARGVALYNAVSSSVIGDTIVVGPGVYTVTSALSLTGSSSLVGIGMPTLKDTTLSVPLIEVVSSNITISNFKIIPNSAGIGVFSDTSYTATNIVIRNIIVTPGNTTCSGISWSQIIGGGTTIHNIEARIYDSHLEGGTLSGYGVFARLNTSGLIRIYNCDVYGSVDGVLFNNDGDSEIYGGNYESTLDALTSGESHTMTIVGARARGDQSDLFGDDGSLTAFWTDFRDGLATGNGLQNADHNINGSIIVTGSGRFNQVHLRTDLARVGGSIFVSVTSAGNVGTGEDDLIKYSVAGNTLINNLDYIHFGASGEISNSINAKRIKVYIGSHNIFDTGAAGIPISTAIDWDLEGTIIRVASSNQKCSVKLNTNDATLASYCQFSATTCNLGVINVLKLTGEATDNSDIAQETMYVEWFPGNT